MQPKVERRDLISVQDFCLRGRKFLDGALREPTWGRPLADYKVLGLFLEPSTRTRLSFEVAVRSLGGEFFLLDAESSSLVKGETMEDTLAVVKDLGFDCVIVRTKESGLLLRFPEWTDMAVVNAGDGAREHPSQAIGDAVTACRHWEVSLGEPTPFEGKRIALVGDIVHSRVARSVGRLFVQLGAHVNLVSPPEFALDPRAVGAKNVESSDSLDDVIGEVDLLYMLRVQRERFTNNEGLDESRYTTRYSLTKERLARVGPDALIMHPGPFNRNVEITDEVIVSPRFLFNEQIQVGASVRKGLLCWVAGKGVGE